MYLNILKALYLEKRFFCGFLVLFSGFLVLFSGCIINDILRYILSFVLLVYLINFIKAIHLSIHLSQFKEKYLTLCMTGLCPNIIKYVKVDYFHNLLHLTVTTYDKY